MPASRRRSVLRTIAVILGVTVAVLVPALPSLAAISVSSFTPTSGTEGTAVVIAGSGFSNICSVLFNGVAASYIVNSTTKISATVPPTNTGKVTVKNCAGNSVSSSASFTVLPFDALQPVSGPPTTTTTVHGSGFSSSEAIDVYLDGTLESTAAGDVHGVFNGIRVKLPAGADPGTHVITAAGRTSGTAATATFTVRTDWPQFHVGPRHTGLNRYENTLSTSNVSGLDADWTYPTGSGFAASPVLAGGRLYVGAGNGRVYALDASTGILQWSFSTGAQVVSSPAVSGGVVYAGSFDGNVYALDGNTGIRLWASDVGFNGEGPPSAVESSPAVTNGVVYVGVDNGQVYALDAATGATRWSHPTGGSVETAPAVANGSVFVGSLDGRVYALDASTGTLQWSYPLGSPVVSSPAVAGGRVFVGTNGAIYALDASTGDFQWIVYTGSDVESSPAVANGVVYAISDNGTVFAVNGSTGNLLWSAAVGGCCTGAFRSPAVANGVLYVTLGKVYALNASTGDFLWSYSTSPFSSPVVANGVVYVGSNDGKVYAFDLNAPSVADHRLAK